MKPKTALNAEMMREKYSFIPSFPHKNSNILICEFFFRGYFAYRVTSVIMTLFKIPWSDVCFHEI